MEFSPTCLDFSSWIYLFWKQTKINLVSKYFQFYLTEQVAYYVVSVKSTVKISSIFVAFLENMNFNIVETILRKILRIALNL